MRTPSNQLQVVGYLVLSLVMTATTSATEIRVWQDNVERPQTLDFIKLALLKTVGQSDSSMITATKVDGYQNAFDTLELGDELDVMVSAINSDFESRSLPIYIPLDRGLLGFRVCVVDSHRKAQYESLGSKQDFNSQNIKVGLGYGWPDYEIMQANHISVTGFGSSADIYAALKSQEIDCYSRSVGEVLNEPLDEGEIEIETDVGLLYPLTDIIYVSQNKPKLHAQLLEGLEIAIEDGSFKALIDKHYGNSLSNVNFYFRNLIIMDNPTITPNALKAINHFGIASFNKMEARR